MPQFEAIPDATPMANGQPSEGQQTPNPPPINIQTNNVYVTFHAPPQTPHGQPPIFAQKQYFFKTMLVLILLAILIALLSIANVLATNNKATLPNGMPLEDMTMLLKAATKTRKVLVWISSLARTPEGKRRRQVTIEYALPATVLYLLGLIAGLGYLAARVVRALKYGAEYTWDLLTKLDWPVDRLEGRIEADPWSVQAVFEVAAGGLRRFGLRFKVELFGETMVKQLYWCW